LTNTFPSITS